MSEALKSGDALKVTIALLLAFLLHLPVFWLVSQKLQHPEEPSRKPNIFFLQPSMSPPSEPLAQARVSPPKLKQPPVQREGATPEKSKPVTGPKELPHRPDFSAGLLSQQISEVSESLIKQRNAAAQGKRMVYASEAKGHTATLTAYEEAWQAKVEHIGNLNYPEAARDQGLSGTLTVAVAIRPDGSLYSVQILKSSGNPIIDDGALKIVRLSAPFAPLPQEILSDIDILIITRSWRFDDQAHFSSK